MPTKPDSSIVTTHYRYKRSPRRKAPVALAVPAVVRRNGTKLQSAEPNQPAEMPVADQRRGLPQVSANPSVIVTAKRPKGDAKFQNTETHHPSHDSSGDVRGSAAAFLERMLVDAREAAARAQGTAKTLPPRRRVIG